MRVWRLVKAGQRKLDGEGARRYGGRYCSPGLAIVPFASEAGLAVLVRLRYLDGPAQACEDAFELGWTEIDAQAERVPEELDPAGRVAFVDAWAHEQRSLLAALRSAVLPEADVILMNAEHPQAALVAPLQVRSFSFADCLHRPPMLDRFA